MLDCIEAFHKHGFVHRDIKASNFAMSDSSNPAKRYVLDLCQWICIDSFFDIFDTCV